MTETAVVVLVVVEEERRTERGNVVSLILPLPTTD